MGKIRSLTRATEVARRQILKDKIIKILKPGECALIYDEKSSKLLAVCRKRGKLEITFERQL
jgi:hypothetical protein